MLHRLLKGLCRLGIADMPIKSTSIRRPCPTTCYAEAVSSCLGSYRGAVMHAQAASKALESSNTKASLKAAFTELMTANSTKVTYPELILEAAVCARLAAHTRISKQQVLDL